MKHLLEKILDKLKLFKNPIKGELTIVISENKKKLKNLMKKKL